MAASVRRVAHGGRYELPRQDTEDLGSSMLKVLAGLVIVPLWYGLRHPIVTAIIAGTVWLAATHGILAAGLAWAVAAVVAAGWWRLHPRSFSYPALHALAYVRGVWVYRRRWAQVLHLSGLGTDLGGGIRYAPHIIRIRCTPALDLVRVKLLAGQTPDDFDTRADELAHAFGVQACRVRVVKPGVVCLEFARRDALATPVAALPIPDTITLEPSTTDTAGAVTAATTGPVAAAVVDAGALHIGVREDGSPWLLRLLYTHVLLVGATGAGKGSVLWSSIRALAPSIRDGSAQVWACDPKGGIELAPGQPMFTRFAYHAEPMVALVEDAAALVQARADRLRGTARVITPTTADPFVLVVIDELAYLTAYMPDRDLRRRLDDALQIVLSQGRAVAVSVIGAVQDPRKDVIKYRDLFPTRIALRLTEASQVGLVLGDGAHDRGAVCERIPHATPGVGFVLLEGDREPTRVRAAYVTDDDITDMATQFPCPASRSWQDFGGLKGRDGGVGQAQVHLLGPVPGDGLVWPELVVLDPVLLCVLGEHDGVVDLVDVEPLVLQRAEPAFA